MTADAPPVSRAAFVGRLGRALAEIGVDHVVLHAPGDSGYLDSDIDIAIGRQDVDVVDAVLRSGSLGRLVQRIHHDVPWCRYYVVATGHPGRPYRQVDVACDPWGLSALGTSISLALASGRRAGETHPQPAEQTLFLLAKRAHKGLRGEDDRAALLESYRRDPRGAAQLLEGEFGAVGRHVAEELARGTISTRTLEQLWGSMRRLRRRPAVVPRLLVYSARRLVGRLRHPTGLTVVVAGPDGTGKSTLAAALPTACSGAFWASRRLHLKPSVLPPPGRLLRRTPSDPTEPHGRSPSSLPGSLARLAYLWADALLAWAPQVALPRRRSALVVIERGWRDLEVDPLRYRLRAPRSLIRTAGALLPHPDLVLVLAAPGRVVADRKSELPAAEVDRQRRAWESIAAAKPDRYVELDASRSEHEVLAAAVRAIEDRLAARFDGLRPVELALTALGGLHSGGRPHSVISIRGQARWVLRAGPGAPGPVGARLYRPFRARQALAALALEGVHRAGGLGLLHTLPVAVQHGLAGEIASCLREDRVELAAMATADAHRGRRAVLSVTGQDGLVAFAKVAVEERHHLLRERDVLQFLSRAGLATIEVPTVLGCFEWDTGVVLLLEPLRTRSFADRPLGDEELAALRELGRVRDELATVIGADGAGVPIHGDFAPWNSAPQTGRRLAVWDWEETRLGSPFEDVFHWRIQRHLRGADASLEEIVADAVGPGPITRAAASTLGIDAAAAPEALRHYLDRTLGRPPRITFPGVVAVREAGLQMLAGAT